MKRPTRAVAQLIGTLLIAAVLIAGGWFAATTLQSPEQRAAAALPPPPGPVMAVVSSGVLREVISAQASLEASEKREVAFIVPSSLAVVTEVKHKVGDLIEAGDVILAVNDRPIFVIPGSFGFYRDITAGDKGSDVRQLQWALRTAGYVIPDNDLGTFGQQTQRAIRDLYQKAGFEPQLTIADGDDETGPGRKNDLVIPVGELLVVGGDFPVKLGGIPTVGNQLSPETALIVFEGTGLFARADIPAGVLARVSEGTQGTLSDSTGKEIAVQVDKIFPDDAVAGISGAVRLTPQERDVLPLEWIDQQVLAVLTLQTVKDESLIVPSRAVSITAIGEAHVVKQLDNGDFTFVTVTELGDFGGQSAISPILKGELVAGDKVKVG